MRVFAQLSLLFCCCIVLTACQKKEDNSQNNSGTKSGAVTTAADTLAAACQDAANQSKMLFVKSGHPGCSWCRVFDRYHEMPEVHAILDKYYVVVNIDTVNMPDGSETFSLYAKPGAPSWVIISPEKEVIVDSYSEAGNVGYPLRPNETAHYLAAIKQATPTISEAELAELSEQIQKAANKK